MSYEQTQATHLGWHTQIFWSPTTCDYIVRAFNPATMRMIQEPVSDKASARELTEAVERVCGIAVRDSGKQLPFVAYGE